MAGPANCSRCEFQHWFPGHEIFHCGKRRVWPAKYVMKEMDHEFAATRSEQTWEIGKVMKPPTETGFTLPSFVGSPYPRRQVLFLLALEPVGNVDLFCFFLFAANQFADRSCACRSLAELSFIAASCTFVEHGSTEQSRSTCERPVLFPNSSPHLFAVSASASYPMPRRRSSPRARGEPG